MCYVSPELYKNQIYDSICDLWSLGIIAHYFRFKRFPFDIESGREIKIQINDPIINIGSC